MSQITTDKECRVEDMVDALGIEPREDQQTEEMWVNPLPGNYLRPPGGVIRQPDVDSERRRSEDSALLEQTQIGGQS